MDKIYCFRIISRLQCVLSYFQDKYAGFNRRQDFRSNLREEQRSDNVPNNRKKQDGRSHNRAKGQHGLQALGPRMAGTARRTAVRLTVHLARVGCAARSRDSSGSLMQFLLFVLGGTI